MQIRSFKFLAILLLALGISGYVVIAHRGVGKSNKYFQAEKSRNIEEDVNQAKQKGLAEIVIPCPIATWAEAPTIDSVLSSDSAVVARLLDKKSTYADEKKTAVVTWLRFEVIDHIAGPQIPVLPAPRDVPEELARNFDPSSDFFVRVLGGSVNQDGVRVVCDGPFSEFSLNKNYVLFVFFDSDTTQSLGGFNFGPESVIPIDDNGKLPVRPWL